MKTQKRFVIAGMFKTLKFLGICLILIALLAPTAHAETIEVNPGAVDTQAQNLTFWPGAVAGFDIVWTDNKTLEWEAGGHVFLMYGPPCVSFAGILLDEANNTIAGTELAGKTPCLAGSDVSIGLIELPETTVFSGIRLTLPGDNGYQWNWDPNDRPVVGQIEADGNQPPIANAGDDVTGQVGVPVDFDGRDSFDPDGTIELYTWDFVETIANDAGPTPTHTFTASGTYNVILYVTDDGFQGNQSLALGGSDSVTVTIAPNSQPPVADAGGPYTGVKDVQFFFDGGDSYDPDGSIVQYDWDFDDGNIAVDAGPAPNHRYTSSGEFFVTLDVTDNSGERVTDTATITIVEGNLLPVADAGLPVVGNSNEAVVFDGSGSSDPDGTIVQYDWNFGDGNSLFDGGMEPSHVYTAPGDYTVYLAVTDNLNATTSALTSASITAGGASLTPTANAAGPYAGDTDTKTTVAAIVTNNQLPTADAGGPYAGVVNQPVIFDGSASDDPDGNITAYDWDFDDGNTGSGLFSTHTYTVPGAYTARLTVTDNRGDTDESTASVIVGDGAKLPPRADANGPYNGVVGEPVTFDGSASDDPDGNITAWDWDFGDSNTGNGPVPDNTYAAGGLYSVILQVTDDDALTASDGTIARIGNLSVPPNAVANGNNEAYKGRVGVSVAFNGSNSTDSDGSIARYDWDFGDGNIANNAGATPTNVYATGGKYIARLTVTDDSGETDIAITVVQVGIGNLPPLAHAGNLVSGKVRRDITFDGTGSSDPDGSVANYAWSFGDGNTGIGPNPTHSYAAAGKYFVTLTVTDNDGATSSDATLVDAEQGGGGGGGGGSCFITTAMGQ